MLPLLGKIISRALQLLGLVGLPDDLKSWWNIMRNHVLPFVLGSGVLSFLASLAYGATWWQAGILAGLLLPFLYLAFFLARAAVRKWLPTPKKAPVPQDKETASRTKTSQSSDAEIVAKRKAVMDLLGDAQEEGESLKQGRKVHVKSENQSLEDADISDEYQAKYDEEVRTWVHRIYNLLNDAFSKAEAQRFISNEGYTDEELLGRELPSFMHLSSTQRKYLIPARLKRLHEIIDRANWLPINPDFDPQDWVSK